MAVAGSTMSGIAASITRSLSDHGIEATRVNQFRFLGAFVMLTVGLRVFRPQLMRVPRSVRPLLLVAGLIVAFGSGLAYIVSLTLLPIATAQALIYTSPIMMLAVACVTARARASTQAMATVAVAVAGCWLVVGASASGSIKPLGVLCALAAAVAFVSYMTIISRLPAELSPLTVMFALFTIAATALLFVPDPLWTFDFGQPTAAQWLGLFAVTILVTLVPYILYAAVAQILPGPVIGVLATIEPVVAVIVAWLALDQSLSAVQITGIALVLLAAGAAQLPGFAPAPERRRVVAAAAGSPPPEPAVAGSSTPTGG
jgi:drug/metabolite transporter (DMT)-like permease